MNSLALLIQDLNLDSTRVLNALQQHGIISDLCVTSEDVGGEDRLRAVDWVVIQLKKRPGNAWIVTGSN